MPRQRAHTAGGFPPAPGHVTDGLSACGQTPPCSSGSALGKSLPQQRHLDRSPLGVHPPRPVRRRAQDDVRRITAKGPARCTLISPIPRALVSAQQNWITTDRVVDSTCRSKAAVLYQCDPCSSNYLPTSHPSRKLSTTSTERESLANWRARPSRRLRTWPATG
jgi:hypothetical protein